GALARQLCAWSSYQEVIKMERPLTSCLVRSNSDMVWVSLPSPNLHWLLAARTILSPYLRCVLCWPSRGGQAGLLSLGLHLRWAAFPCGVGKGLHAVEFHRAPTC